MRYLPNIKGFGILIGHHTSVLEIQFPLTHLASSLSSLNKASWRKCNAARKYQSAVLNLNTQRRNIVLWMLSPVTSGSRVARVIWICPSFRRQYFLGPFLYRTRSKFSSFPQRTIAYELYCQRSFYKRLKTTLLFHSQLFSIIFFVLIHNFYLLCIFFLNINIFISHVLK